MQKLVDGEDFSIYIQDQICYVNFSSPSTHNAISMRMAAVLQEICRPQKNHKSLFETFLAQNNCLLIVMQSLVKGIFCSGGNLKELIKNSEEAKKYYTSTIRSFCKLLHNCSPPSITILEGPAYGGGVELALSTDFRFAIGNKCEFHFTQAVFGIPSGWGGMTRLQELCPQLTPKKIAAIICGKFTFKLNELCNYGIVDKCFKTKKACLIHMQKWKDKLLDCPEHLIQELSERQDIENIKELEQYDFEVFDKYFLNDDHINRIKSFFTKKNK